MGIPNRGSSCPHAMPLVWDWLCLCLTLGHACLGGDTDLCRDGAVALLPRGPVLGILHRRSEQAKGFPCWDNQPQT